MLSGVVQLFVLIHPLVGKALYLLHVDAFGRVLGIAAAGAHRQGVALDLVGSGHHLADQVHLTGTGLRVHRADQQQGKFIAAQTKGVVPAADAALQPLSLYLIFQYALHRNDLYYFSQKCTTAACQLLHKPTLFLITLYHSPKKTVNAFPGRFVSFTGHFVQRGPFPEACSVKHRQNQKARSCT